MKKYVILIVSLIAILILVFAIISNREIKTLTLPLEEVNLEETNLGEEIKERNSGGYKITDDAIFINLPQDIGLTGTTSDMITNQATSSLRLTSSIFNNQETIPSKYTCDGENISPSFEIFGVNPEAKSLVLIMDDPDASPEVWNHWIKFNIPPTTQEIIEGEEPEGISGEGTGGDLGYSGPCPPDNEHSYVFRLYSLDAELTLPEGSSREEVEKGMEGHILQTAELTGKYERVISL